MDYKRRYVKYKTKYYSLLKKQTGGNGYYIIITVPHAVCLPGTSRREKNCDLRAVAFSKMLHTKLSKDFKTHPPIIAKKNRRQLDNNRLVTTETIKKQVKDDGVYITNIERNVLEFSALWKELKEVIRKHCDAGNSYKEIIVFDTHTFPDKRLAKLKNGESPAVVIMDNVTMQPIVRGLIQHLQNAGISVAFVESIYGLNAIKDVMRTHPLEIKTILIEVNEKLTDQEQGKIIDEISNFLKAQKS